MKEIPLTQGKVTLVDDADFEWLNQWKWYAHRDSNIYYACRYKSRKTIRMHRVILNAPKELQVDHINHDGLDNRRTNIRLCTPGQNCRNSRKRTAPTSSRFKGVCWEKPSKKWRAQIRHGGKIIFLGMFVDETEAAHAYNRAAIRLHGEFASLNQIGGEK